MLPTSNQMVMERKEEEMLAAGDGTVRGSDGTWRVVLRFGDILRTVEAGPDRECAEAVLQLMKEGRR